MSLEDSCRAYPGMKIEVDTEQSSVNKVLYRGSLKSSLDRSTRHIAEIDTLFLTKIAMQLLASCFTLPYDLGVAIVSCCMLPLQSNSRYHHGMASNAGLIDCLHFHTRLSKYPAFGHHARNASIVAASPGLAPLAVSRVQLIEGVNRDTTRAALIQDLWGPLNQSPRRSRTQLSDSQDDNTTVATGVTAQYLSKRQSRYTEDFDHSSSRKASWHIRPSKEHFFHRWKRFKRKTRSEIFASTSSSANGPKSQRPSHPIELQDSSEMYDVGSYVGPDMGGAHEQDRTNIDRSSSAPSTLPDLHRNYKPSRRQEPSPLTAVQNVVPSNYHTTFGDADFSYFALETQHTDLYVRTRSSMHRLHRTSTSGTTVYTPPIIAEANPNTEKLKQVRGSDGSSNSSSGNGKESLSFL